MLLFYKIIKLVNSYKLILSFVYYFNYNFFIISKMSTKSNLSNPFKSPTKNNESNDICCKYFI